MGRAPQIDEGGAVEEGENQDAVEKKQGEEDAQGAEENQPSNDFCDFTVYLQRDGEANALAVECTSIDGEVLLIKTDWLSDLVLSCR
jgi:hypothetical protein